MEYLFLVLVLLILFLYLFSRQKKRRVNTDRTTHIPNIVVRDYGTHQQIVDTTEEEREEEFWQQFHRR